MTHASEPMALRERLPGPAMILRGRASAASRWITEGSRNSSPEVGSSRARSSWSSVTDTAGAG